MLLPLPVAVPASLLALLALPAAPACKLGLGGCLMLSSAAWRMLCLPALPMPGTCSGGCSAGLGGCLMLLSAVGRI
eukprot:12381196-Alexandrium_andersonii.AAC.1